MRLPLFLTALLVSSAFAAETYLLKEPDEALGLSVETLSVAKNSTTTTRTEGGVSTRHKADVVRWRQWNRTFRDDALGGKVHYRMLRDEVTTRLDGDERTQAGPLHGRIAMGQRNGAGNWVFTLAEGAAVGDQVTELESIQAIENRRWLPNRKVAIGETWEFTPQFIRNTLRRDVRNAVAVGLMELVAVDKMPDGGRQARIKVVVRAGGEEVKSSREVVGAEGMLSGEMTVELDRPGAMVLRLAGTVVSEAKVGTTGAVARIPVTLRFESKPLP
jgi:hypothetical protein